MGNVIWVNRLEGDRIKDDDFDKPFLFRFSTKLDRIGQAQGIGKISRFFDFTDYEANLRNDFQGYDDGYALLRAKGKWFPPTEGMELVAGLLKNLKERPVRFGLMTNVFPSVVEELEDCMKKLRDAQDKEFLFTFLVVM